MDTEELKSAMLADEAVADNVAALEEKVGGAAPVEVTDDAAAFDQSKVSIVGANLNNAESAEEPIKLVIDKPEKDHVLDAAYDNAVAVKFSMDLANVEDTENLAVPVKITLPIPSTINPGFLVILHYHADGTVEEIHPYIEVAGNQYFANFVLTSFSDFVMTETVAPDITRIAGINRIGTSMDIAKKLKSALGIFKFDSVIVASALNFPDALTGSYLAAVENAPILLTYDAVHAEVQEFIRDHLAVGGTVYILGGEGAVSKAFETGLEEFKVQRVAGSDRFGTNLEILKTAGYNADQPILIATAVNFADSLSASAAGLPMLLVHGSLRADQKEFLATTSRNFVIIGGTSAVSEELEAELKAIGTVERLAGNGRYQTSVMVAQKFISEPNAAVLAYARNFPDGLCGGPLAYALGAPLILTDNYDPSEADKYIEGIKTGIVVGGPGLISDESASLIFDLN
jgi:putative cell wall-binding protein